MKKRILALALCLALAVSLLPVTAAADMFTVESVTAVGYGDDKNDSWLNHEFWDPTCKENFMTEVLPGVYEITYSNVKPDNNITFGRFELKFALNGAFDHSFGGTFVGSGFETPAEYNSGDPIKFSVPYDLANITLRLDLSNFDYTTETGATFTIAITDANHHFDTGWTSDETYHWHKCLDTGCTETKDKALHFDNDRNHLCDDCQASIHTWQFTKPDSGTLKATCNPRCSIGTVTATLSAGPVTLPDSPFKAKLTVSDNFKEAFPNAVIGDPVYRRKGPGERVYTEVDPTDPNPKAGDYQVSVHISGLPGRRNEDAELMSAGAQSASVNEYDLTVDYTVTEEGGHRHDWRLSQPDTGTMTISCAAPDCPKSSVTVNLSARSVTLPDSPFNAVVTGGEALRKAFPGAEIGELVYKYKGDGDSEYRVVAPTAANAIAGQYQVGVRVTGLPTTAGYADLYVKYTAADPAVTAQTGDNRPIELMMAGVAVFSALAAAAFVVDSRRRYQR